jgi:hypothetical protein
MSPARGGKAPPSTRWLVFVSALLIGTVVCLISLIIGILAWRQARTDLAAARRLTKAGWIVIGCGIVIIALSGIASGA